MSLKILLQGKTEEPGRFAGSGPLQLEINERLINEERKLRLAFERLAFLIALNNRHGERNRVIGVDFHSLEFSLIYQPEETATEERL